MLVRVGLLVRRALHGMGPGGGREGAGGAGPWPITRGHRRVGAVTTSGPEGIRITTYLGLLRRRDCRRAWVDAPEQPGTAQAPREAHERLLAAPTT